jgi:hypothetical protein
MRWPMPSRPSESGRTSRTRKPRSGLRPSRGRAVRVETPHHRSKEIAIQPKDNSVRDDRVRHDPVTR